jgi:hypothetical protein
VDYYRERATLGFSLERARYNDDYYYRAIAQFYAWHGHDVELTAALRPAYRWRGLEAKGEISYARRYNRDFLGLDGVFSGVLLPPTSNFGLRLILNAFPHETRWLRSGKQSSLK